jgi:hypothetical protein
LYQGEPGAEGADRFALDKPPLPGSLLHFAEEREKRRRVMRRKHHHAPSLPLLHKLVEEREMELRDSRSWAQFTSFFAGWALSLTLSPLRGAGEFAIDLTALSPGLKIGRDQTIPEENPRLHID